MKAKLLVTRVKGKLTQKQDELRLSNIAEGKLDQDSEQIHTVVHTLEIGIVLFLKIQLSTALGKIEIFFLGANVLQHWAQLLISLLSEFLENGLQVISEEIVAIKVFARDLRHQTVLEKRVKAEGYSRNPPSSSDAKRVNFLEKGVNLQILLSILLTRS